MVSEGDSGSQSWSGVLRGLPGPSSAPCLARATSGTPSSVLRDVPDWACLSQTPSPRPWPHTQACQGPEFWGRHSVGGKVSVTVSAGFLFLLWSPPPVTPFFSNFHFPAPTPLKSPLLFPLLLLLRLTSRLWSLRLPPPLCPDRFADATSPLTSLPAQTPSQILSGALSSPPPSTVPTAHRS